MGFVQPPLDGMIYKASIPSLPQFRFEWHPQSKKVYLIRVGTKPEIADPIGDAEVETQGQAIMCMLYWARGYQEAKRELEASNAEHRRAIAR